MSCRVSAATLICIFKCNDGQLTWPKHDMEQFEPMRRFTEVSVLIVAHLVMQVLVATASRAQQPEPAVGQAEAAVPKPGIADGKRSPALTGVRRPLYRLRSSDVVDIGFTFSPEFNQSAIVQPDGYIPLKGAEPVYAEGSTLSDLRETIVQAYTGVLHDPEVTLVLKDFDRPYFIAAGEVGKPGKYELRSDLTVSEAVALAGGFTQRSRHSEVVLFRHVSEDTVESHIINVKALLKARSLGEDMHLQPGDFVFVPQNTLSKVRQFLPASSLSMYATPTQF